MPVITAAGTGREPTRPLCVLPEGGTLVLAAAMHRPRAAPPFPARILHAVVCLVVVLASVRAHAAEERSDAVVGAVKPQRLAIARGRPSATRSFAVVVRNANQRTVPGPGFGPLTVQLAASAVACAGGTMLGVPDFDRKTPGSQPTVSLAPGKSGRAMVTVTVQAADVTTPSTRARLRCRILVEAAVVAPAGNVDPRQTNDATVVELDVVDRNDTLASAPAVEVVAAAVKPIRTTLPGPGQTRALTARLKVGNVAAAPVVVTLSGDDGDCPAGTLAALDADGKSPGVQASVSVPARRSVTASIALEVRPPLWSTADGASPARCTLRVRASAPVADAEPSNDEIVLTLDTSVPDAVQGAGCPSYASPATQGGNPPSVLGELSGLAASRRHPGVYWAHNDSGNAFELYALAADGSLLQTIALDGADAEDIEDVAVARCSATTSAWCVYLADVGDNGAQRSEVAIYRLPEPDLTPGQTLAVDVLPFTYPGGPRDAESLVAETLSGRLFVVSKILTTLGEVFRLDGLGAPGGGTATSIATLGPTTPADVWLTAADAHPSGESVLLRSYTRVWELRSPGALVLEEVFASTPVPAVAASQPQGEALAFAQDGLGYVLGSEQLAPLRWVGCSP